MIRVTLLMTPFYLAACAASPAPDPSSLIYYVPQPTSVRAHTTKHPSTSQQVEESLEDLKARIEEVRRTNDNIIKRLKAQAPKK